MRLFLESDEEKSPENEDAAKEELAVENQSDFEDSVVRNDESTVRREQENSTVRHDDAAQYDDYEASLVRHEEGDGMVKSQEIAEQLQDNVAAEATDVDVCGAVHGLETENAVDAQFTAFPRFADFESDDSISREPSLPPSEPPTVPPSDDDVSNDQPEPGASEQESNTQLPSCEPADGYSSDEEVNLFNAHFTQLHIFQVKVMKSLSFAPLLPPTLIVPEAVSEGFSPRGEDLKSETTAAVEQSASETPRILLPSISESIPRSAGNGCSFLSI